MPVYAVAAGFNPGIYYSWEGCRREVEGYSFAIFRKFNTLEDAEDFLDDHWDRGSSASHEYTSDDSYYSDYEETILYAVAIGYNPGIYDTWEECRPQVLGYSGNRYKKCYSRAEAEAFIEENSIYGGSFIKDGDHVVVFVDGACSGNGRYGARAGIGVWFGDDHPLNVSAPVVGRATSNTAEIQAARVAVETAVTAGVTKLQINTDSEFVINAMTKWISGWKKYGWKLRNGRCVKNKPEFVKLDKAIRNLYSVEWVHVPAHSNVYGNEMADWLAREATNDYDSD